MEIFLFLMTTKTRLALFLSVAVLPLLLLFELVITVLSPDRTLVLAVIIIIISRVQSFFDTISSFVSWWWVDALPALCSFACLAFSLCFSWFQLFRISCFWLAFSLCLFVFLDFSWFLLLVLDFFARALFRLFCYFIYFPYFGGERRGRGRGRRWWWYRLALIHTNDKK